MRAELELFISKWKCRFGKHILDFENDVQHHCYCGKKYVRKPTPKLSKEQRKQAYILKPKVPRKKVTKKTKPHLCPVQGKVSRTEKLAKIKAKEYGQRAYKCAWCSNWHLTHKKDNLKKH